MSRVLRSDRREDTSYGFAALLVLVMGAGPMVVYAVTALSPLVVAELDLSRADLGTLAGVTFLTAAACSVPGGRLVDRGNERAITVGVLLGAVAALGLVASATQLAWLIAAAAVSGASQSLSNPVTNRLVSAHAPAHRLGLFVGVKQSGVQLGQLVAGALLPGIAAAVGWRVAVACAALVVLSGMLGVRSAIPVVKPRPAAPARRSQGLPGEVWWLLGYTVLTAAALQATNVYLPLFAHQQLGISVTAAGLTAAVAGGTGVVARIGWSRLAQRPGARRPLLLGLALAASGGLALLIAAETLALPWLVWLAVVVHGSTALGSNAVVMLTVIGLGGRAVGAASGALSFGLYLGFALGPLTFGFAVDGHPDFTPAWLAVAAAYLAAALLVVLWWALTRHRRGS